MLQVFNLTKEKSLKISRTMKKAKGSMIHYNRYLKLLQVSVFFFTKTFYLRQFSTDISKHADPSFSAVYSH